MKEHVEMGMNILAPMKHLGAVLDYVRDHHEHFDGTGYPRQLSDEQISIGGRILAAADAYDALVTGRSYQEPLDAHRTLDYLGERVGTLHRSAGLRRAQQCRPPPTGRSPSSPRSRADPQRTLRATRSTWCAGRKWSWRAILLAYLAYVSVRSLNDYEYWTIFAGITLGVHEAGHVVFAPFGELLAVAGGSIMQIAVPLIVACSFFASASTSASASRSRGFR